MRDWIRAAVIAAAARLRLSNQRPDNPQEHWNPGENSKNSRYHSDNPKPDMPHAEWVAFQTLIREIHKSDKEHQTSEKNLGVAQHRTAKGLNWITAIGAIFGAVGSVGIIGSLIIAKQAADDARDALHQSQRPWVSADSVRIIREYETARRGAHIEMAIGVILKNTGTSIAKQGFAMVYPASGTGNDIDRAWDKSCGDVQEVATRKRERYQTGFVLAPGQSMEFRENANSETIADEAFKRNGFWLIGCAIYSDEFGITHHTRFCFVPEITALDSDIPRMEPCGTAEEAD